MRQNRFSRSSFTRGRRRTTCSRHSVASVWPIPRARSDGSDENQSSKRRRHPTHLEHNQSIAHRVNCCAGAIGQVRTQLWIRGKKQHKTAASNQHGSNLTTMGRRPLGVGIVHKSQHARRSATCLREGNTAKKCTRRTSTGVHVPHIVRPGARIH